MYVHIYVCAHVCSDIYIYMHTGELPIFPDQVKETRLRDGCSIDRSKRPQEMPPAPGGRRWSCGKASSSRLDQQRLLWKSRPEPVPHDSRIQNPEQGISGLYQHPHPHLGCGTLLAEMPGRPEAESLRFAASRLPRLERGH